MQYSNTKLDRFTIVQNDEFQIYLKNRVIAHLIANTSGGFYIWNETYQQKYDEVYVYKRIFDNEGNLLQEPVADADTFYICDTNDGTKQKVELDYEQN